MESIEWKTIPGYSKYLISNTGVIKSFFHKRHKDGYIMKTRILKGYERVILTNDDKKEIFLLVHRLVAIAFIPNPENKEQVNHINGIKSDNNLENLEWNTKSENIKHAYRTKLCSNAGEKHPAAKISDIDAIAIRKLKVTRFKWHAKNGLVTRSQIAKEYGVSLQTIRNIINGRYYKHLL